MRQVPKLFWLFLVLVFVTIGVFVLMYLGLGFSKLTFDPQRKDMPLVVLNLTKLSSTLYMHDYQNFERSQDQIFGDGEFAVLFRGRTVAVSEGTRSNEWHRVSLTRFARTDDFVKSVTDPRFPEQSEVFQAGEVAESVQYIGHANLDVAYRDPLVMLFAEISPEGQSQLQALLHQSLSHYAGRVEFSLPVENITQGSDRSTNYLALIGFADMKDLVNWVKDTIRKTQFAMLHRQLREVSLVIAVPE